MALPRSGSRSLTVDGVAYRWLLAPNDEGLLVIVESADAPARRLQTWFAHGVIVTPQLVCDAVARGRALGWVPSDRGPDIIVHSAAGDPTAALAQCACCDHFTLPRRGDYDICKVCFWEDDGSDIDELDRHSGPNHGTLRAARAYFAAHGACDERSLPHVLPPAARGRYASARRSP